MDGEIHDDYSVTIEINNVKKSLANVLGIEFVYVPPGEFIMGSPKDEEDRESNEVWHNVTLTKGFYLQKTQVTQGQWKKMMVENPSKFGESGDDCPVEQVSWYEAQKFIEEVNQLIKIGKCRLPTEAEWEYSARAGSQDRFCFGDSAEKLKEYAWYKDNSGGITHAVATKRANKFGLYDMHGNVWEWCRDWYGDYATGKVIDPRGPVSGKEKVIRGGCLLVTPRFCRAAFRGSYQPDRHRKNLGFRLVFLPDQ